MKQQHFKYGNTSIIELELCSLFSKRVCSSCSAHISIYLFPWHLWTLGCFPRFVRVRNWDPFIGLVGLGSRAPGAPESREWEDPQPSFTEENPIKWEDPHCGLWVPKRTFYRRNSHQTCFLPLESIPVRFPAIGPGRDLDPKKEPICTCSLAHSSNSSSRCVLAFYLALIHEIKYKGPNTCGTLLAFVWLFSK